LEKAFKSKNSKIGMRKLSEFLNKANRLNLARRIKRSRKLDRRAVFNKGKTWKTRRNLSNYSELLRVDLDHKIFEMIKNNGSCKMLDIGCGQAHALADAKMEFGNNLITHGLRLIGRSSKTIFPDNLTIKMINKLHVGSVENYIFREKFDLIVSVAGLDYSHNSPLAIEKVCNSLKQGGEAFIHLKKTKLEKIDLKTLEKQGFQVIVKTTPRQLTILEIKNIKGKPTNLIKDIQRESKKRIPRKLNTKEKMDD
jgi:SAM-dependent methyltransferase